MAAMRWWTASARMNSQKAAKLLELGWEPFEIDGAYLFLRIQSEGSPPGYDLD